MDIVLNTTFLNALLPTVPIFGFSDNFNRADAATLGLTSGESKAWLAEGTTPVWSIVGNRAGMTASGGASSMATVDAATADGVLQATLAVSGTAKTTGLAFRVQDYLNGYYLSRENASSLKYTLYRRVASTATAVSVSSKLIADGDVVRVELSGSSIIVKVNDVQIITATDTQWNTKTRHGFFGSSSELTAKWDDISFTAA